MRRYSLLVLLLATTGCAGSAPEAPAKAPPVAPLNVADCDRLSGAALDRARGLLATSYIHDCCDQRLADCLAAQPRCTVATRLAANVCRRVSAGENDAAIERALQLRARTMEGAPLDPDEAFDLSSTPAAGDTAAPVTIVLYAGPRGTHCARMTPLIHAAVTSGPLAGKAVLYLRPFPLRSNPNSVDAGKAFVAAERLGKLWELVLHSYARFDQFSVDAQAGWAEEVGLDRSEFERLVADPEIKSALSASKLEGLENGVDSTPTFFVDGRLYRGELEIHELVDTVLELYDRRQGHTHE